MKKVLSYGIKRPIGEHLWPIYIDYLNALDTSNYKMSGDTDSYYGIGISGAPTISISPKVFDTILTIDKWDILMKHSDGLSEAQKAELVKNSEMLSSTTFKSSGLREDVMVAKDLSYGLIVYSYTAINGKKTVSLSRKSVRSVMEKLIKNFDGQKAASKLLEMIKLHNEKIKLTGEWQGKKKGV
jgi:hypothetical protein